MQTQTVLLLYIHTNEIQQAIGKQLMNALQIAQNETFQQYALIEAMTVLSKDTGISIDSLIEQFPTNMELQKTCAKIVAETAKLLAD